MKKAAFLWIALLTGLLPVTSSAVPSVYIDPVTTVVDSSAEFEVKVMVTADADTMSDMRIVFQFDDSKLEFLAASAGSLYVNCGHSTDVYQDLEDLGIWGVGLVIRQGLAYVVAPGELCILSFRALQPGMAPIEFQSVMLKDGSLYRRPIEPVTWADGWVCIGDQASLDHNTSSGTDLHMGVPFPNPARSMVTIPLLLGLYSEDRAAPALVIYDPAGRLIATIKRSCGATAPVYVWDGRNDSGREVNPGVYFVTLTAPERTLTRKLVMIR